ERATNDGGEDDQSGELPDGSHWRACANCIDCASQQPGDDTGYCRRREYYEETDCKWNPVRFVIWDSGSKVLHIWHVDCRPHLFMSLVITRRLQHGGGFMVQYIPRLNASLALSCALLIGACSTKTDNSAAADSALNKDIQLANRDTAAQPALTDIAASSTAPATATSRTTTTSRTTSRTPTTTTRKSTTSVTSSGNTVTRNPGGTAARVGTIPAGATLNLASGSKICTNTNKVGERFNASVTDAVVGSNGAVIPAGATATVEVTELKRSENANDNVVMGFRVVL